MTQTQRTLGAIFYDKFELLDNYGPLEMFGSVGPELRIVTVAEKAGPVASVQGPQTRRRVRLRRLSAAGSDPAARRHRHRRTARQRGDARVPARSLGAKAELTMSVCSGSAILAKAGLLDGLRATSNKQWFDLARGQSAKVEWVTEARWVEDGAFATSSGVSAGMDMALAVIARLYGKAKAQEIADATEYSWHTDAARDPFVKFLNKAMQAGGAS